MVVLPKAEKGFFFGLEFSEFGTRTVCTEETSEKIYNNDLLLHLVQAF